MPKSEHNVEYVAPHHGHAEGSPECWDKCGDPATDQTHPAESDVPECRHDRFWSEGKWRCRHCSATWDDSLEWVEQLQRNDGDA